MKKLCLLALALILTLSFGCSAAEAGLTPESTPTATDTPAQTENPAPPVLEEETAEPTLPPMATPIPTPEFDPSALSGESFAEEYIAARAANPQVAAFIVVPNTAISYPVALGDDNDHYLHTTITGEESKAGAIFFDYRTNRSLTSRHMIVYGHNMKAGTMFHDLNSYKHKDFFQNNRIITLYAGSEKREYQVYAAFIAPPDVYFIRTGFNTDAEFLEYMNWLKSLSKFETDVELTVEDQILTLATCTYEVEDGRFVVQARRIDG